MREVFFALAFGVFAALAAGFVLTMPERESPSSVTALPANIQNGETVFWLGACESCHKSPNSEELVLAGGREFKTDFGTFVAPNITPDLTAGIGAWSFGDFYNALRYGTSPEGSHYYPSFPYSAYNRMTDQDIADLWSYLRTLPASDVPSPGHRLTFPFNLRAGIGVWKALYLKDTTVQPHEGNDRGTYLVEAIGHCAECHTPRTIMGGLDEARWMAGAPNQTAEGRIPGITPAQLNWSTEDIAYYLETGFTPDFDVAGGSMTAVIAATSRLSAEDRTAIAEYVKALQPTE